MVDRHSASPRQQIFDRVVEVMGVEIRQTKFDFPFYLAKASVNIFAHDDPLCAYHGEEVER